LEKQAAVKRTSTIRYLNVKMLIGSFTPMIPSDGFDVPGFLEAAGVANLDSIGGIAGFSTKGMVDRTFANFKDTPKGLFELFAGKPLSADDLKPIPGKTGFAIALRLDPMQVYKKLLDLAERMDPKGTQQFKQTATGTAQAFGFRLEEDVVGSFGDVWTLHGSVTGGADQLAELVLTVTVKNKETLTKIQKTALQMLGLQAGSLPFNITEVKIEETPAWQLVPDRTGAPSPAWAIAGGRLVIAGSLDTLKTQLAQGNESGGLGELPAVVSRLKTEPVMLTYQDTKTMVEQWLIQLRTLGPLTNPALAQLGIKIEMPQLPDFKVIAPHLLPRTSTLRISKQAVISEAFETVPLVGNSLSAIPAAGLSMAILAPAIQATRQTAGGNQSMNQIKQISLAMLNEQAARTRFPPAAICDKDGKPLLSWRVKLLPYLGEPDLYNQFHLDEPWDSENNKPLAAQMPAAYLNARVGDLGGKTVYLVPTGEEMIFCDTKGTSLRQITDGTSKTILIVEVDAEHAVPWTKPDDLAIDEEKPAAALARMPGNGTFLVGFADGSVQSLPGGIEPATLWAMFTRAGGEVVARPGQ
jgi:Protein of unknown function (DUF1559)